MGSGVGLLAGTLGRLYSSAFYALKDPRTPLNFAAARVAVAAFLTWVFALAVPRALGIDADLGAAGITLASGVGAWLEFLLLRRGLDARIGRTRIPPRFVASLWSSALLAAAVGLAIKYGLTRWFGTALPLDPLWLPPPAAHPVLVGALVLGAYGGLYFVFTAMFGLPEGKALLRRLSRRRSPS
jgi:putative peptidoglycan lipid II flippase